MSNLAPPAPERALDHLLPQLYDELRMIARRLLAREREGHTLTPTALLHEAYLRLGSSSAAQGAMDPLHFRALAARVMRHVLVDHALSRKAEKRGGPDAEPALTLSALDGAPEAGSGNPMDLLAVHQALERLAAQDERAARVVELRCFGGLDLQETADALQISLATVKRDWLFGKTMLAHALKE